MVASIAVHGDVRASVRGPPLSEGTLSSAGLHLGISEFGARTLTIAYTFLPLRSPLTRLTHESSRTRRDRKRNRRGWREGRRRPTARRVLSLRWSKDAIRAVLSPPPKISIPSFRIAYTKASLTQSTSVVAVCQSVTRLGLGAWAMASTLFRCVGNEITLPTLRGKRNKKPRARNISNERALLVCSSEPDTLLKFVTILKLETGGNNK